MVALSSIGRTGAVTGTDGAAAFSSTKRTDVPSFGKSLEYVIGASQAEPQRNAGNGAQTATMRWQQIGSGGHSDRGGMQPPGTRIPHAGEVAAIASSLTGGEADSVKPMVMEMHSAATQQAGFQQKSQPSTSPAVARLPDASTVSGTVTQEAQGATAAQRLKSDNNGFGASGVYQFDSVPSTLDPGSMAFLVAWLGGSTDGQSVRQQQQAYLETYRQRYPDGVPGVKNYTTAATNYLTGTS